MFFRPFLGGIFLDRELATSSRMLDFVIRMMAAGEITLPGGGMGTIPQLAARLPPEASAPVVSVAQVESGAVTVPSDVARRRTRC
jgi:hypothetical protein